MIASLGGSALVALTPRTAVSVEPSRCVRHRCSKNACTKCVDVCPTGAVTWNGGLDVDATVCTQCLRCLAVCPTAALSAPELSLRRLLSDLAEHPLPVLGCHGQPDTEAHARVACLGYLADPEFMVLVALVFSSGLHVNLTACADCSNGHILDGIRTAHMSLDDLVPDHSIKLVRNQRELDFEEPSLSRRQLFSHFRKHSTRTAATVVSRLQGDERQYAYGDKLLPAMRVLLLKVLKESTAEHRRTIADRLFGEITFTSACAGSRRCVGVCPTGAIQPVDDDEHPPDFDRDLCVSCGSCVAFCPNQGVLQLDLGIVEKRPNEPT